MTGWCRCEDGSKGMLTGDVCMCDDGSMWGSDMGSDMMGSDMAGWCKCEDGSKGMLTADGCMCDGKLFFCFIPLLSFKQMLFFRLKRFYSKK
jgi:hypothetical protein